MSKKQVDELRWFTTSSRQKIKTHYTYWEVGNQGQLCWGISLASQQWWTRQENCWYSCWWCSRMMSSPIYFRIVIRSLSLKMLYWIWRLLFPHLFIWGVSPQCFLFANDGLHLFRCNGVTKGEFYSRNCQRANPHCANKAGKMLDKQPWNQSVFVIFPSVIWEVVFVVSESVNLFSQPSPPSSPS